MTRQIASAAVVISFLISACVTPAERRYISACVESGLPEPECRMKAIEATHPRGGVGVILPLGRRQ